MGLTRTQAFPSQYLGKEDVTQPMTLTIVDVYQEEISGDGAKELKAVMKWREPGVKPMILNNTNWMACEDAYGPNTDGWINKPVEVFIDPSVMYGGKRVGGVRVRVPANGHNGFGHAPAAAPQILWSIDEAANAASKVGISRDDMVNKLKAAGFKGWNPPLATPFVQAMIAAKAEGGFGGGGSDPFTDTEDPPF